MTAPRVVIEGEEHVAKALAGLADDVHSVEEPSRALGERGLAAARAAAPYASGMLEGSIGYELEDRGVALGSRLPYAPYQEFGTRYVRARRFIRAGFEEMSDQAGPVYTRWLAEKISRANS